MQPETDGITGKRSGNASSFIKIDDGIKFYPAFFNRQAQENLRDDINQILQRSPLFTPKMPKTGQEFSVKMSNVGELGWVSDIKGYRYQSTHPITNQPFTPIPKTIMDMWQDVAEYPKPPQACLINLYAASAKMGLHQDRDEEDFNAPIVSVSLGATALFRIGGLQRQDKTRSIKLSSGDVIVFGGKARLIFHGIDRLYPNTSTLLPDNQRINLTLRRVTA